MACLVKYLILCLLVAGGMCGDQLTANTFLNKGESLVSNNGYYRAVFQTDGNFVIYTVNGKVLWASNTAGKADAAKLILQTDNNLVMYTYGGVAVWSSKTAKAYGSNCVLIMQNDGNLVTYRSTCTISPIDAVWSSGTAQK
ncbi:mannose-specific lectin-like isoform X2 [Protopterus annectens]|uniref:mannose-specific lectin-like isoform X2 n=1 Tax=Protopterus annectens TaxID=7888 RepID=UPI001CFB7428|nr:mannose-specific lectin-like isoform X2 [Protopterus annectens]